MHHPLLIPDLREMIVEKDYQGLAEFVQAFPQATCAEILVDLENSEIWEILSHTSIPLQTQIFEYLDVTRQAELVAALEDSRLKPLIEEMSSDNRNDLLKRMEEDQVERLLPLIAQAERSDIKKLLSYPEGSAGSIMTTEYTSLPQGITIADALTQLRHVAPNRETIYYIYVLDEERHLRGFVSLRRIILAKQTLTIDEIMDRNVVSVHVADDQEVVAKLLGKHDFLALPVIDEGGHLVGIITYDDVLDVVQEEHTEDAHLMGAVQPLEDSYLATSLWTITSKRVGWLILLFASAFLTARVLQNYQKFSAEHVWIGFFVPLVIASGGNAGSQTATLVIRAFALGEATLANSSLLMRRELYVGLILGGCLSSVGFLLSLILVPWQHALVISFTVALVVLLGTIAGSALPLAFRAMKMDPALMSTPLIACLLDVLGIVLYYQVAGILLALLEKN